LLVLLLLVAVIAALPLPVGLGSRTAAAQTADCPCSIWSSTTTPVTASVGDGDAVELGVKFQANVDGLITGVRFYKGSANSGTHVGRLWSSTGALLASATFDNETPSGWQQVNFSSPVAVTAGTTYVASYYAPNGYYAHNGGFFSSQPTTNGPLTALQSGGTEGGNGVYHYASRGGFPTDSWNASNYWLDVVFDVDSSDTTPPTITNRTPGVGQTGVPVTTPVTAKFSESVVPGSAHVAVTGPGGAGVPGGTDYDVSSRTVTFSTSSALADGTTYNATVTDAQDPAGNLMAPVNWSFTTTAAPPLGSCPCTIWSTSTTPATASVGDSAAVELGVKFRADANGFITGVRFYKGSANTGPHVGKLWATDTGSPLASATFTSETASGWQQVLFSSPVPITAGTTYVASYYAPNGRYALTGSFFTADVTNGPLTAPQSGGVSGGNGVYRYGDGSQVPTNTWNASNYWVDVVFDTQPTDTTPPTVSERTPGPGATDVAVTTPVTATFNEPIQPSTVNVSLTGPGGATVDGLKSYDEPTRTVTFTPSAALAESTSYAAAVSAAKDSAGNTMAAVNWSFTTTSAAPPGSCPCTIWSSNTTPLTPSAADDSAIEVGVKFRADENGFATGLRFYKGTANDGTHVGNLWSASGAQLATVTFTDESTTGWQQALFSAPVPIVANTTYVASYHAPQGHYAVQLDYFANGGTSQGPLTALQNGTDGPNGVYKYGTHAFPTDSYRSSNYFVDVVFDPQATDTVAPTAVARVPAPGATEIAADTGVTATFSEPVQQSTTAFELRGPGNSLVPAPLTYETSTWTAKLTPQAQLAYSTAYTANLSGAKDAAGNTMAPLSWTFTTGAAPAPGPEDGPGGPIAVLTSNGDRFTKYTAEILRAEGFNEFAKLDMGSVTGATLASYDVAVLGSMTLTSSQVTMLNDWVNAGGNLIAIKPDPQLASLLGISPAGGTMTNGYLKVDTAQPAGAGITSETMQFHGTADLYNLSGATSVAALYSGAGEGTATTNPAVTLRSVGSNGGHVAAFTYDLDRSIVLTRQGNPAWAGVERDKALGEVEEKAKRSDDLYYGALAGDLAPDWVDLEKVAIPQADEQQRLLANLIEVINRDRKPLPRFWYLPDGHKAVVVATGDDHAVGGTAGRFDQYVANSAPGCSVANWECLRFTSYVYPDTLANSQAVSYQSNGFEVASHPENGCTDYPTQNALAGVYQASLAAWHTSFPGLTGPVTNRFHCLVWSDWSSQPKVEFSNGIRLDTNYYYWPGPWMATKPGFMTGSGLPMRFADSDGTIIDVYQATTQMTNESGQSYPETANFLLDRALGPEGYYGAFVANMHSDHASEFENDQLMASAQAHNVPMITARQLLTWLDGRNESSFGSVGWSGNTLSFAVQQGSGANGLQGMLPTSGPGGTTLSALTRGGSAVSYNLQTIKGLEYATFSAANGSYVATYSSSAARVAPSIGAATVSTASDGTAQLQWQTSEPATSEVVFGATSESLGNSSAEADASRTHAVTLDELRPGTTYYYRVRSRDLSGVRSTWPPVSREPLAFTTPRRDTKAPAVSAVKVLPLPDGTATVTWRTSEPADSHVDFGTSAGKLDGNRIDDQLVRQHSVVLTQLQPGRTYWYRVSSRDAAGNSAAAPRGPGRFLAAAAGVAEHTAATFRTGTRDGVVVEAATASSTGELALAGAGRSGRYVSHVLDARAMVTWDRATWQASVPNGAVLRVFVRTGSTSKPDRSWTPWQRMSGSGAVIATDGRYLQYRVELVAGSRALAAVPKLAAIGFTHNGTLPVSIGETPD
jgi:hypothetical protein